MVYRTMVQFAVKFQIDSKLEVCLMLGGIIPLRQPKQPFAK